MPMSTKDDSDVLFALLGSLSAVVVDSVPAISLVVCSIPVVIVGKLGILALPIEVFLNSLAPSSAVAEVVAPLAVGIIGFIVGALVVPLSLRSATAVTSHASTLARR